MRDYDEIRAGFGQGAMRQMDLMTDEVIDALDGLQDGFQVAVSAMRNAGWESDEMATMFMGFCWAVARD